MVGIIGGGLAGLACAVELARAGRSFVLLEASDGLGGRVRTDKHDGLLLDRGFQVLLTSYPHIARYVDVAELSPRYFDSGALIRHRDSLVALRHPAFHPDGLWESITSPALPVLDKVRLGLLGLGAMAATDASLLRRTRALDDRSVATLLESEGFSRIAMENFFRPFFGGVLLDNHLESSAALFLYYLKKFATGRAWLPAGGIGELPNAMARRLPEGAVRLNSKVTGLVASGDRVEALELADGTRINVDSAVVALDAPSRCALFGWEPPACRSVAVVYFRTHQPLYKERLLVLPPGPESIVRHFVQLTNVVPEYAPSGVHLISATVLDPEKSESEVRAAIRLLFPGAELEQVATRTVANALPVQRPGFGRPAFRCSVPSNVRVAGDGPDGASIESALASGRRAAEALL
ncbi:MAG: NAD(P)/FAD-dependent oxidoreductase [Terrimicrobiaceae bacterium]|nr:NAD(P)/FAD-dependent oxidoreductase [Terrimicrobiaceae bacterium]